MRALCERILSNRHVHHHVVPQSRKAEPLNQIQRKPVITSSTKYNKKISMSKRVSNRPSQQLDGEENEIVYSAIGRRNVSLSTTVAQLYLCAPGETEWSKRCVGM